MLRSLFAFCFSILLALPGVSYAADIDVRITPQVADPNDTFQFSVTIKQRTPLRQEPQWASSAFFSIRLIGRSNEAQYVNGELSARTTFQYELRPLTELTPGRYETPDGTITIDGKTTAIPRVSVRIRKASSRRKKGKPLQSVAFVQRVSNPKPFIGEQITYHADVAADAQFVSGNLEDIKYSGFWREELGDYSRTSRKRGDLTIRSLREVLIPTAAGEFTIPKRKLMAEMATKSQRRRPSIFDRFAGFAPPRRTRRRQLFADEIKVSVRPLPASPDASQSYIPVGEVKMRTAVNKKEVLQGESVSLTITLWGRANLRPFKLTKSQVVKNSDFKMYYDKPKSSVLPKDGHILFSKVFRVAFVPQKHGELSLPTFTFYSFDPETEKYVSHRTDSFKLSVKKDPNFVQSVAPEKRESRGKVESPDEAPKYDPVKEGDLYPLKSIDEMRRYRASLSHSHFLVALFVLVAVVCGLYARREWKQHYSSRHRQRISERALGLAKQSLEEGSNDAAALKDIIATYLDDRFDIHARAMTPRELQEACRGVGVAHPDELLEIIEELDRILYAPGESPSLPDSLNQRVLNLLTSLDKKTQGIKKRVAHG